MLTVQCDEESYSITNIAYVLTAVTYSTSLLRFEFESYYAVNHLSLA